MINATSTAYDRQQAAIKDDRDQALALGAYVAQTRTLWRESLAVLEGAACLLFWEGARGHYMLKLPDARKVAQIG